MRQDEPATRPSSGRAFLRRAVRPFQHFARSGARGGILLLACTAVALAWANSPWADAYHHLWEREVSLSVGAVVARASLHAVINDGLMAVFFFLVGLEIKREVLAGELASARRAALPVAAALAIVDDMGAVLVIAIFYAEALHGSALLAAAGLLALLVVLNVGGVRRLTPYLVVGIVLWLALLSSGVHATIAGVLLALTIPARTTTDAAQYSARAHGLLDEFERAETGDLLVITSRRQQEAIHELELASAEVQGLLLRLEHALTGVVSFGIMPLFALANAGVRIDDPGAFAGRISLGVVFGLLVGKPLGVGLASWLAVKSGVAALPSGVTWRHIRGVSLLAGIGFTMSLFVAGLAFGESERLDAAKLGVLAGSVVAGVAGYVMLRRGFSADADRGAV
jgi:NhaA family Na+:H+ antiporter